MGEESILPEHLLPYPMCCFEVWQQIEPDVKDPECISEFTTARCPVPGCSCLTYGGEDLCEAHWLLTK